MTRTMSGRSWKPAIAAGLTLAVLATTACRPAQGPAVPRAQAGPGGQPMLIACGAGEQPLIRQVAVNGAWVPQVECVASPAQAEQAASVAPAPMFAPAAPVSQPAAAPGTVAVAQAPQASGPYAGYQTAAVEAPMVVDRTPTRHAPARRVVNVVQDGDHVELAPQKKNRSWQKSAIIIGSSAGVGAGVGAAAGGKKGALIGAAIGGGAATIWDQATRR